MLRSSFSQRPDDVNDPQWQAIIHDAGHLLIVAGPGTGKTHTLTRRILSLIPRLKEKQKILAVTFTNKAGKEMRDRLNCRISGGLVPGLSAGENAVTVGTFHCFCLGLLRQYFASNLPQEFRVPSPEEIKALSKELWPALKDRERRDMLDRISLWKARDFERPSFSELLDFNAGLRSKGWLDFDDLLLETVRSLNAHRETLNFIRRQYPFICVDEYQDINPVQHQLLKILAGPSGTVNAIGDPRQAIYGFRGADVKYFASFEHDFPGAAVMTLSENYRSTQNLLSASNQVMRRHSLVNVPALTAKIYAEGRLMVHEAATDKAEAEYVVHQIEKMVGGTSMFSRDSGRTGPEDTAGRGFGEIAVLFRLNSQLALLEQAFDRSGIPYQISVERNYEDPEELLANAFKHSEGSDKVSLMTLHASKGLEFAAVFIVGCEDDILPLKMRGRDTDKEEERRLFYVGVTRAKEDLWLTRARKRRLYGETRETKPSPFLADIEEELKEYEHIEAKIRRPKKDDGQMQLF